MAINMTVEEIIGVILIVVLFGTMMITYTLDFFKHYTKSVREETIDEFVEELKEYGVLVILTHKEIDRLAEQLKGDGK